MPNRSVFQSLPTRNEICTPETDPLTLGAISSLVLILLVVAGVHIAFATALTGFIGIAMLKGWSVAANIAGIIPHSTASNCLFSVLPMFILIGFFARANGMVTCAYRVVRALAGWMPGELAISTVLAAASFGAVSGASQATAAFFARVAIPELLRFKYNPSISAAAVAASGTLASPIRRLSRSLCTAPLSTSRSGGFFWQVLLRAHSRLSFMPRSCCCAILPIRSLDRPFAAYRGASAGFRSWRSGRSSWSWF